MHCLKQFLMRQEDLSLFTGSTVKGPFNEDMESTKANGKGCSFSDSETTRDFVVNTASDFTVLTTLTQENTIG